MKEYRVPADIIIENADVLKPKKFEYQHASGGRHFEPEIVCECGKSTKAGVCPVCKDATKPKLVPALDSMNNPKVKNGKVVMRVETKDVAYGKNCEYGDMFHSNSELDKLHNRKGQPSKFIRLDEGHNPDSYSLIEERQRTERLLADKRKLLERINREQLQEYAEQELGMDFKGRSAKREAILEAVIKHEFEAVTA